MRTCDGAASVTTLRESSEDDGLGIREGGDVCGLGGWLWVRGLRCGYRYSVWEDLVVEFESSCETRRSMYHFESLNLNGKSIRSHMLTGLPLRRFFVVPNSTALSLPLCKI